MPPIHMPFFFDVAMAIASMGQQNATSQENVTGGRPRRSAAIPSMEARWWPRKAACSHEIGGAAIAIGKSTHGVAALFGGNPSGQAVAAIDRHSESRAQRRSIERHHRIEMQPVRFLRGKRRANDARRVADDECHLFGRAQACGDKQVALALAIVVIGDDDKLAAREGTYGRADTLLSVVHIFVFAPRRAVRAPVAQTATPDCRRLDRAAVDNGRRSRMPSYGHLLRKTPEARLLYP